jgi:hypothetical protein
MNPHAANRIFDELTAAEMSYRMTGLPVSEFLKRRANRYNGEVKRNLLRVANLGINANQFMDFFLNDVDS